jgi:hypothetical protein
VQEEISVGEKIVGILNLIIVVIQSIVIATTYGGMSQQAQ